MIVTNRSGGWSAIDYPPFEAGVDLAVMLFCPGLLMAYCFVRRWSDPRQRYYHPNVN